MVVFWEPKITWQDNHSLEKQNSVKMGNKNMVFEHVEHTYTVVAQVVNVTDPTYEWSQPKTTEVSISMVHSISHYGQQL